MDEPDSCKKCSSELFVSLIVARLVQHAGVRVSVPVLEIDMGVDHNKIWPSAYKVNDLGHPFKKCCHRNGAPINLRWNAENSCIFQCDVFDARAAAVSKLLQAPDIFQKNMEIE